MMAIREMTEDEMNEIMSPEDRDALREMLASRENLMFDDQSLKNIVIDAIFNEEQDTEFVVEGAKVVCTSMKKEVTVPAGGGNRAVRVIDGADAGSKSLMTKLDDETRGERKAEMIAQLQKQFVGMPLEAKMGMTVDQWIAGRQVTSPFEGLGNCEKVHFVMNQEQLLTHLDIEFYPLFGQEAEIEDDGTWRSRLARREAARAKADEIEAARESNADADDEDGECECLFSDDGKCKPYIENLMWQDVDVDVQAAGAATLLKDNAYMFCHHGQGILYIEESGQHRCGVLSAKNEASIKVEDLRENYNQPDDRDRDTIVTIIRHHSGCLNDDQIRNAGTVFSGPDWGAGTHVGYHELILRDGTVQILHEPEVIAYGMERNVARDRHQRPNNRVAYHISLVGTGPMDPSSVTGRRITAEADGLDGYPFTEQQELAFRARVLYNMERFGIGLSNVKGHNEIESNLCPGMRMDEIRNWITHGVPVDTIRRWHDNWDSYVANWNSWLATLRTWRN